MHRLVAARTMLLLGFMSPALLPAAELYRYVDERGVVVLDRHGVPSYCQTILYVADVGGRDHER